MFEASTSLHWRHRTCNNYSSIMISSTLSCLALLAAVTACAAYPRYVAIPLEDLVSEESGYQPVYLSPDGQVIPDQEFDGTRQLPSYLPQPSQQHQRTLEAAGSARVARGGGGHHHGDLVDYGAYTGGHGAFGWYTDHPVHGHHH